MWQGMRQKKLRSAFVRTGYPNSATTSLMVINFISLAAVRAGTGIPATVTE